MKSDDALMPSASHLFCLFILNFITLQKWVSKTAGKKLVNLKSCKNILDGMSVMIAELKK